MTLGEHYPPRSHETCATQGDTTERVPNSVVTAHDFGWALGTMLRAYLKQATELVANLPGGTRGYQVMAMVASGTCQNQAAIAEQLGIDRTVMTSIIDALEAHGLVERTPDPRDRRARQITLTEDGVTRLTELAKRIHQVDEELLAGLSEADAALLRTRFIQLAKGLVDHEAKGSAVRAGGNRA